MSNPPLKLLRRHGAALAYADGTRQATYEELSDDVQKTAARLRSHYGHAVVRIAWHPQNDYATLVTFWSLFEAGYIACPLSPRFPPAALQGIVQDLRAQWLDTPASGFHSPVSPNGPGTILLSSGSTGAPKRIAHHLEEHFFSARAAATIMPLSVGDRWLWSLPPYHVSGLSILFRCAASGATVCGDASQSPLSAAAIDRERISHLSAVATQLQRLLVDDEFPNSSLRGILLGGSAIPSSLMQEIVKRQLPVHTTYGMTEFASQIATSPVRRDVDTSSGSVLPHCKVRIGAGDEIMVRGDALCLGYAEGETLRAVTDEDGWFHTGDRGKLDEHGLLTVLGRIDNMFISGGENVYPEAIEAALLDIPEIGRAVVVPRQDNEFGFRPVAIVEAAQWNPHTWSDRLRHRLRSFELPIHYLPFPTGHSLGIKPDRSKLRTLVNESPR